MKKQPPAEPPRRQNILKMMELLKKFKPLVNEKNEITGFQHLFPSEPEPDVYAMLKVMTGAVYDIQSFIKNWDKGMEKQAELISDAMMAHQAMANVGIQVNSLAEGFEKVTARHKQALDVLDFISTIPLDGETSHNLTRAVMAASGFINPVKQRIAEMSNEPTTDGDTNNHPSFPSQAMPPPQPDAGAGDQEAEPRS